MRAFAGWAALVLTASLGACAQSTNFSDIGLFGGGDESAGTTTATASAPAQPQQAPAVAGKPSPDAPASSRGTKKAAPAKGGTAIAGANAPSASGAAQEKPAAKTEESGGISLASMTQLKMFSGSASPDSTEASTAPVATYSMLAQRIHACWFTPGKPQLTNHGFHAEVAPDGSGDAKIIIYEKGPDNKRGIQVFRITISRSGSNNSAISSENRRLDAKLDAAFKSDLVRWAKGDERCRS